MLLTCSFSSKHDYVERTMYIDGSFARNGVMFFLPYLDYVLVHEDDFDTLEEKKQGKIGKKEKDKMTTKDKHEMWRLKFVKNLEKSGLEMEEARYHLS